MEYKKGDKIWFQVRGRSITGEILSVHKGPTITYYTVRRYPVIQGRINVGLIGGKQIIGYDIKNSIYVKRWVKKVSID